MKGNKILIAGEPKGKFFEGIASGTVYPGTVVTVTTAATQGGRHTYEPYNTNADNDPRPIIVVLEDVLSGKTPTQAYTSGSLMQLYAPALGEELNMLVAGLAGTGSANVVTIGERFGVDDGTGKLIVQATPANRAPFTCMERTAEPINTDTLTWVMFGIM